MTTKQYVYIQSFTNKMKTYNPNNFRDVRTFPIGYVVKLIDDKIADVFKIERNTPESYLGELTDNHHHRRFMSNEHDERAQNSIHELYKDLCTYENGGFSTDMLLFDLEQKLCIPEKLEKLKKQRTQYKIFEGKPLTDFMKAYHAKEFREISENTWKKVAITFNKQISYYQWCMDGAETFIKRHEEDGKHNDILEQKAKTFEDCDIDAREEWFDKVDAGIMSFKDLEDRKQKFHDFRAKKRAKHYNKIIQDIIPYNKLVQKIAALKKRQY